MSRISLGLRRVAARERGVASHGACGRSLPCLYGRSLRLRASSQAHYGVDEDEEWWPGRVLGVHSQGAHAGLFDVLYDDGALQPNLTLALTQP
jgi:hypothetical protein